MTYSWKIVFITTFFCFIGLAASECPPFQYGHLLDSTMCFFNPTAYTIISTNVGKIGGKTAFNRFANIRVSRYLGIRFGKPPIGNQRFMEPIPADPFNTTAWALNYGNTCIGFLSSSFEDCLFLNVYVPQGCTLTSPCAVMVWIFGGAFVVGSSTNEMHGPEYFLENNVIFVSFNYRLGAFGFLSSEDGNIPGNAGLLDQNLALKWVNQNIEAFGGNKNSITIFGESAGAASVCYHCMSDQSAGLFQKVILESGSCLSDWAYSKHPLETLYALATQLDITTKNTTEIKKQLQDIPAEKLATASMILNIEKMTFHLVTLYSPSIDYNSPIPFIADSPRNIIKKQLQNNQPICYGAEVITGFSTNEGGVVRPYFIRKPNLLSEINTNKELLTPPKCNLVPGSSRSIAIGNKIYNYYFSNQLDQWSFYEYVTHMHFMDGVAEFAKAVIDSGKTPFLYNFNYCGPANYVRNTMFPEAECDKIRTIHGDDLTFTFTSTIPTIPLLGFLGEVITTIVQITRSPAEIKLGRQMVRSFTNIAKISSPNLESSPDPLLEISWLPSTSKSNMTWMRYDTPLSIVSQYLSNDIEFWANVCNPN